VKTTILRCRSLRPLSGARPAVAAVALALAAAGCARSGPASSPPSSAVGGRTGSEAAPVPAPAPAPAAAPAPAPAPPAYPDHTATATVFWVGEPADSDSGYITNVTSAWDDHWRDHFGGVDDPDHRAGWRPAGFVPRENPFYVALPYDDFDDAGHVKPSAARLPWAADRVAGQSVLKNRWVRVEHGGQATYAQWEDVGPFQSDDFDYVFGAAGPSNKRNDRAGIDVSPAIRDALALDGEQPVSWRFVDRADVPAGPWLSIVTTSGVQH
jgi:hypothetical protein